MNINLPNCICIDNKFYRVVNTKPDKDGFIRCCSHCVLTKQCKRNNKCLIYFLQDDAKAKHFEEFELSVTLNI